MILFVTRMISYFGYLGNKYICSLLAIIFPFYMSFKALNSSHTIKDDRQALTFWIIFGFWNCIEFYMEWLVYWIPFYYWVKTFLLLWLIFPIRILGTSIGGSHVIYEWILVNMLPKLEPQIDQFLSKIGIKFNKCGQVGENVVRKLKPRDLALELVSLEEEESEEEEELEEEESKKEKINKRERNEKEKSTKKEEKRRMKELKKKQKLEERNRKSEEKRREKERKRDEKLQKKRRKEEEKRRKKKRRTENDGPVLDEIGPDNFRMKEKDIKLVESLERGGGGGHVYKAKYKYYKGFVAVKKYGKSIMAENHDYGEFEREAEAMSKTSHPNVLHWMGYFVDKSGNVGFVMKFCKNGDLERYILKQKKDGEESILEEKLKFATDIANAMYYLHNEAKLIHRDLKLKNILLDEGMNLLVMDFGLAKFFTTDLDKMNNTRYIGTPGYIAPEITRGQNYDQKVDVFSFGIVLFSILFSNPYPYKNVKGNVDSRVAFEKIRPQMETRLDEELREKGLLWIKELIVRCWDDDPTKRPSFEEIQTEYFNKIVSDDEGDE